MRDSDREFEKLVANPVGLADVLMERDSVA